MAAKTARFDERWERDSFTFRRMKKWEVQALAIAAFLIVIAGTIYVVA